MADVPNRTRVQKSMGRVSLHATGARFQNEDREIKTIFKPRIPCDLRLVTSN